MTRLRSSYSTFRPRTGYVRPDAARANQGNVDTFAKAYPEIMTWLRDSAPTFEFAASLLNAVARYGRLTERQLAAAQRCVDGQRQRATQREERAAQFQGSTFPAIVAAFAAASASGLRRPKLRCVVGDVEVMLSPAGPNSANVGFLYVKAGTVYMGKISPAGVFSPGRYCTPNMLNVLRTINENPTEAARNYARFTAERDGTVGNCCCCGALLTNPESVRLGIGPVCGSRWGWL